MREELDQAKKNLEDIKTSLRNFLRRTYEDDVTAVSTFRYLSKTVGRAIKKESIKIEFAKGGDVSWYMTIFHYLSNWMEAEKKTSDLLNQQLESIEETNEEETNEEETNEEDSTS
jgi:hypothetical protein